MHKQKVMRKMRVLLLVGLASVAIGATSASAGVHVYLPPIPLPPAVVFSSPSVSVGIHPVPPPPVYYAPPTHYRYVDHHHYYERPRYHHKHKYDRHHHKHHRGCDH